MKYVSSHRTSGPGGLLLSVLLLWCVLVPGEARAQEDALSGRPGAGGFNVGVSYFGVTEDDVPALALELGYRRSGGLPWSVEVQTGVVATSAGSAYGYVGIVRPFHFSRGLVATPFLGVGGYHRGRGTDLGSALEFRSGISLGRKLDSSRRVSVDFYHLSNGGIGDRNPGVEVLGISYTVAFSGPG